MAVAEYGANSTRLRNAVSEAMGFNVTDMECLRLLYMKGVATPTELARHTGLTSGATTAMLDRLENAGFIVRSPNPDDRRGTLITPVKLGAEQVASWFESARRAQEELLSTYSASELETIADVFERLAKVLERERQKLRKES